jgi:hypothetical protein
MDMKEYPLISPATWDRVCSPTNPKAEIDFKSLQNKQNPGKRPDWITRICCPDKDPHETEDFLAYWEQRNT